VRDVHARRVQHHAPCRPLDFQLHLHAAVHRKGGLRAPCPSYSTRQSSGAAAHGQAPLHGARLDALQGPCARARRNDGASDWSGRAQRGSCAGPLRLSRPGKGPGAPRMLYQDRTVQRPCPACCLRLCSAAIGHASGRSTCLRFKSLVGTACCALRPTPAGCHVNTQPAKGRLPAGQSVSRDGTGAAGRPAAAPSASMRTPPPLPAAPRAPARGAAAGAAWARRAGWQARRPPPAPG